VGILFIHAGDSFARRVFEEEHRGYWSQALPLVLEKHGFFELEEAGPEALMDPRTWEKPGLVLIGRLPGDAWNKEVLALAQQGRAQTLVEAALPSPLLEGLGIEQEDPIRPVAELRAVHRETARAAGRFPAEGFEVGEGSSVEVERDPELHWSKLEGVPVAPSQAEAWRAPGWDIFPWSLKGEATVLAEWRSLDGGIDRRPAIVSHGSLTTCAFTFFAFLGQRHTAEPFEEGIHRYGPPAEAVESLFLGLIDLMYKRAGIPRLRVLPWPHGTRWIRNVRHDFDRPLDGKAVDAVLDRHRRAGSVATWYWRSRHVGEALERVMTDERHEIALHTERLWMGTDEEQALEKALGRRVEGSAAHGAADCFRYQGAPNVLWADQRGWSYTEELQHRHYHPHRFAALAQDGTISMLEVLCLPSHISFESGAGDTHPERVAALADECARSGGLVQVMNHPDMNVPELFETLEAMPSRDSLDWTAFEAASWWRRTHRPATVSVKAVEDGSFALSSEEGIAGVAVELLAPDGTVTESRVDAAVGAKISVRPVVSVGPRRPAWEPHARFADVPGPGREEAWPLAGILLIHGGDGFAREVYRWEGRGYWSQALGVVLEKHGYLAFEEAGPEALLDPRTWRKYAVVIVARLPEGSWSEEAVAGALGARGCVLVEGPLPGALAQRVGIERMRGLDCEGSVTISDDHLRHLVSAFGMGDRVRIGASVSRPIPREPERNWDASGSVPISAEQAAAWRRPGWDAEAWRVPPEARVLASWAPVTGSDRYPGIVSMGPLICCSFGLLSAAVFQQTSEPYKPSEHRVSPTYLGTEALLLGLLDCAFENAGATRARVMPWPAGARWVRSVRHDFDRQLTLEVIEALLSEHARVGSAATWYWRARHAGEGLARVAAAEHHEVAIHTEQLWSQEAEAEQAVIEAAVGYRVSGSSAHGDPSCFRFQGAPNVLWAEVRGWSYTEMLHHLHQHPHRFPWLSGDGTIAPLDVVCLPRHQSFEAAEGQIYREQIVAAPESWSRAQGLLQVMNHPDINVAELFEILGAMPEEGRLDWTAREAIDWWRRTHMAGNLELWPTGRSSFGIRCRAGAKGLVIELRTPDGRTSEHALDLAPHQVGAVSRPVVQLTWPVRKTAAA
jgi:hypothetical protein